MNTSFYYQGAHEAYDGLTDEQEDLFTEVVWALRFESEHLATVSLALDWQRKRFSQAQSERMAR